jgi:hypothetical protein
MSTEQSVGGVKSPDPLQTKMPEPGEVSTRIVVPGSQVVVGMQCPFCGMVPAAHAAPFVASSAATHSPSRSVVPLPHSTGLQEICAEADAIATRALRICHCFDMGSS